jgi:hypothetical protein
MKTQLSKPARFRARYSEEYKQEALGYGVRAAAVQPRSPPLQLDRQIWVRAYYQHWLVNLRRSWSLPFLDVSNPLATHARRFPGKLA